MQGTEEAIQIQVDRILHSDAFRNADSLRKLLKFLSEKLAQGEADQLKEYAIGIDALGKPPTYDPRSDATVRIQVGRLRQKLADYYLSEGKDDEWVVSLPKGRFRLVCEAKQAPVVEAPAEVAVAPNPEVPVWMKPPMVAAIGLLAVLSLTWALTEFISNKKLEQRTQLFQAMWTQELEELWQPFIGNTKPLIVSIADPPFAQFEGGGSYRELTLNTWEDIQKSPKVAKIRAALGNPNMTPGSYYSPIGEVSASFSLGKLLGPRVSAMSLLRTSELSLQQMADNNILYIGAAVFFTELQNGSPVTLEFGNARAPSGIAVLHPRPGDPAKYTDALPDGPAETGEVYALATHIPGPRRTTDITAFTGNRTPARLAAVEWFTEPQYAKTLVNKMRKPDGTLPSYYQVVLRVKFMNGVPTETTYVTHRELNVKNASGDAAPAK